MFPAHGRAAGRRPAAPRRAALLLAAAALLLPAALRAAGPESDRDGSSLAPAASLPRGADPVGLALEVNGQPYGPGVAIVAKPRQVLQARLVVSAPKVSRSGPGALIENAAEGRGRGGVLAARDERLSWEWSAGIGLEMSGRDLTWRAPESGGRYAVQATWHETERGGSRGLLVGERWGRERFDAMVLEEYDPKQLTLNGAPIGVYPDHKREDAPAAVMNYPDRYQPPRWFLKVAPDARGLYLSTHFKVGDFAMDPARFGDLQYIVVEQELLDRLEKLHAILVRRRLPSTIRLLRGYLTPLAAEALRRDGAEISEFSRFLYGDAAAIVVDADNDGRMDDLNRDGAIDGKDALLLADACEEMERETSPGGLGVYGAAPDKTLPDTPFVHIDARGGRARWEFKVDAPAAAPAATTAPAAAATP